jgi:Reverse transcriptase (RNA-dependent DNA polymerase)
MFRNPRRTLSRTQTSTDSDSRFTEATEVDSAESSRASRTAVECALCHVEVVPHHFRAHIQREHKHFSSEFLNKVQFEQPGFSGNWHDCVGCKKVYKSLVQHQCGSSSTAGLQTWEQANGPIILDGSKCPFCKQCAGNQFSSKRVLIDHIYEYHGVLNADCLNHLWPNEWEECRHCGHTIHTDRREIHRGLCTGIASNAGFIPPSGDNLEVLSPAVAEFANVDADEAAPDLGNIAIDMTPEVAVELCAWYHYDFNSIFHKWKDGICTIAHGLLKGIADESTPSHINDRCLVAFYVLPGLLEFVRRNSRRGNVQTILDECRADPDPASWIIRKAQTLRTLFPHQDGTQADPQVAAPQDVELRRATQRRDLQASFNKAFKNGRLKQAKNNLMAMRDLQMGVPPPERLTAENELRNIRELFPPRNADDDFPESDVSADGSPLPAALQITANHVRDIIPQLDSDTSAGVSGFTMVYYKLLFGGRALQADGAVSPPTEAQTILTGIYNKVLRNEGTPLLRMVFTWSRVLVIPKKGDSGPHQRGRPLGIGEVLYRVLGKIVSGIMGKKLAPLLAPLQNGIGVKDACPMIARMLQELFDAGYALIGLDVENAFNSLRRRHIYDAVRRMAPELIPILRFSYASQTDLRNSHGEHVHFCGTGVTQGDPLSLLFFCLGFQALLIAINAVLQRVINNRAAELTSMQFPCKGLLLGFVDDIPVAVPPLVAGEFLEEVAPLFEEAGLKLKPSKCQAAALNLGQVETPPGFERMRVSSDGLIALGVPVGTPEYVRRELSSTLDARMVEPRDLLLDQPAAMFRIISTCINPSVVYFRRAIDFTVVQNLFKEWDEGIEKLVHAIFQVTPQTTDFDGTGLQEEAIRLDPTLLHNRVSLLLRAPRKLGGLGVAAHYGMEAERGELIIRMRLFEYLRSHQSLSIIRYPDPNTQNDIRIGKLEDRDVSWTEHHYTAMQLSTLIPESRALITETHKTVLRDLLVRLTSSPHCRFYCAWLRSILEDAGSGPLAWMRAPYDHEMPEFLPVMQLYFGIPSIPDRIPRGRDGYRCECQLRRPDCATDDDPCTPAGFGHPLRCPLFGGRMSKRHTLVKHALYSLLRNLFPTFTIAQEVVVGTNPSTGSDVVADIVVRDERGNDVHVIDVAVVTPAAHEYTDPPYRSDLHKDAAAVRMEIRKRQTYAAHVPAPKIVPFIVEATGRLGPTAKEFLQRVCNNNTFRRSQFITQCSWLVAVGAGQISDMARRKIRPYDGPPR